MDWRDHVRARLLEIRPASVCALDETSRRLARRLLPDTPALGPGETQCAGCALALGIDALSGLSAGDARQLISRTRLYVAPRLLLVAQADCALDAAGFRSLGFTASSFDVANRTAVYFYDIETYKTVPDWLNARFWAHPERWEP